MAYVCVCAACDVVHVVHVVCSVLCVCVWGYVAYVVCGLCIHIHKCADLHGGSIKCSANFSGKCIWSVKSDNLGSNPASTTLSYLTLGTLQNVPVPQFSHL